MEGEVVLPKLEEKGREWLEQIRLETMKNDDKVKARQRFRICPTTMRMMTCIMLCKVARIADSEAWFPGCRETVEAESAVVEGNDREDADANHARMPSISWLIISWRMHSTSSAVALRMLSHRRTIAGSRHTIVHDVVETILSFERLDVTFTFEQAQQQSVAVKGANVTHEAVRQMLKNWKRQGLINILPDSRYQKVASTV